MTVHWDVLGFGGVSVDDLLYVDRFPASGSKMRVRAELRQGGGLMGTALVAAARLGATVAYAGVLGDDELAQFTRREFAREGVDCSLVLHDPAARPGHSIIIVDQSTGQRTILGSRNGFVERAAADIDEDLIASCRVLFVDHTIPHAGRRAIELAHRLGVPVVADVEVVDGPAVSWLLDETDHLVVPRELARRLSGESEIAAMVRALARPARACVVVTAGEQGCWYAERDGPVSHVPALAVQVVDTTGCGDVFHGAYAACLARGDDVTTAVRVATIAAGLKATTAGGRAGIPTRDVVERVLLQNNPC